MFKKFTKVLLVTSLLLPIYPINSSHLFAADIVTAVNGWRNTDAVITLTADNDPLSGTKQTEYRLDSANWNVYSAPFTVSKEGSTLLETRTLDNAGNYSSIVSQTLKIDKTKPGDTAISMSQPSWTNQDVTVNMSAGSDAVSGVQVVQYNVGNGWNNYLNPLVITSEGDNLILARTADNAANIGNETNVHVLIDKTAPTSPVVVATPSYWHNGKTILRVTDNGSDNLSGVSFVEYRVGAGAWIRYDNELEVTTEGKEDYEFRTSDKAGNLSPVVKVSSLIDTIAPTQPLITFDFQGWGNKANNFKLSGSSDINFKDYHYKVDEGEYTVGDNGNVSTEGIHAVTYYATDLAGNPSSLGTSEVKLDLTPAAVDFPDVKTSWYKDTASVNVVVSDKLSGVKSKEYSINHDELSADTWSPLGEDPVVISAEGIWYLHVRATDEAGNVTEKVSSQIKVQSLPDIPTGLTVVDITEDSANLYWNPPASGRFVDGYSYMVQYNGKSFDVAEGIYTYKLVGLSSGKSNNIQLKVKNHIGEAVSDVSALTLPSAPASIKVDGMSEDATQAYLYIDAVEGADTYHIVVRTPVGDVLLDDYSALTTYTLRNMHTGVDNVISVSSVNATGEGSSRTLSYKTIPGKPDGFTSVQVYKDKVILSWSDVVGADFYRLLRDGNSIFFSKALTQEDIGLSSGTAYNYSLRGVNDSGEGVTSDNVKVITLPAAPEDLDYKDVSSNSVTLFWKDVVGATGYLIYADGTQVGEVSSNQFKATIDNGANVNFTVIAKNSSGVGEASSVTVLAIPGQVQGLTVSDVEETSFTLHWTALQGVSHYEIVLGEQVLTTSDTSIKINQVVGGTKYSPYLRGVNSTGSGEYSDKLQVLTLSAAVQDLQVTGTTNTAISVSWLPEKSATSYWVNVAGKDYQVIDTNFYSNSFTAGDDYVFVVTAENATGKGTPQTISWTTRTLEVDSTKVQTVPEVTTAAVSWIAVHGASQYTLGMSDGSGILWSGTDVEVQLKGLTSGADQQYYLWSTNKQGLDSAKTLVKFTTKPAAPAVKVSKVSATSASINIATADKVVSGYKVLSIDGKELKTVTPWTESYTFIDQQPATVYKYKFVPYNETGDGNAREISFATPTLAVDNVSTVAEDTYYDFTLSKVDGAVKYIIIDDIGNKVWSSETLTGRVLGLQASQAYLYKVLSISAEGMYSEPTNFVVLTKPTTPQGITAIATGNTVKIDVSGALRQGVEEFVVYRDGVLVGSVKSPLTVWEDKDLAYNSKFIYTVYASNGSGLSSAGQVLYVTTEKAKEVISGGGGGAAPIVPPPVKEVPLPEVKPPADSTPVVVSEDKDKNMFIDTDKTFSISEINLLAKLGIVKGSGPNIFEPDREITRIEFAALIVRALKANPDESIRLTFSDINSGAWYTEELNAALANNIAKGFSDNEFRPNDMINREQASKMINNVMLKNGIQSDSAPLKFTDDDQIIGWAFDDVKEASALGILEGYPDGTFQPKGDLTRAESAALIYRMLDKLGEL